MFLVVFVSPQIAFRMRKHRLNEGSGYLNSFACHGQQSDITQRWNSRVGLNFIFRPVVGKLATRALKNMAFGDQNFLMHFYFHKLEHMEWYLSAGSLFTLGLLRRELLMSCLINIIASLESAPVDFREFAEPIVVLMSSCRIDGLRRRGLTKQQPWSNRQQVGGTVRPASCRQPFRPNCGLREILRCGFPNEKLLFPFS